MARGRLKLRTQQPVDHARTELECVGSPHDVRLQLQWICVLRFLEMKCVVHEVK